VVAMSKQVGGESYDLVMEHLYIGDKRSAKNLDLLHKLGVTHIVNVTSEIRNYFEKESNMSYLKCPLLDSDVANIAQYFEASNAFIDHARRHGHTVLVHCQQGVSRSATLILAYQIGCMNMPLAKAYADLRSRRSIVKPKPNFISQLVKYERTHRAIASPKAAAAAGLKKNGPTPPHSPVTTVTSTTTSDYGERKR
jgi:protein-tyrosine phosphatase